MSKEPNDVMQNSSGIEPNSSALEEQAAPAEGTTRDRVLKKMSKNPKFELVENSGQGFVIVGAKPKN